MDACHRSDLLSAHPFARPLIDRQFVCVDRCIASCVLRLSAFRAGLLRVAALWSVHSLHRLGLACGLSLPSVPEPSGQRHCADCKPHCSLQYQCGLEWTLQPADSHCCGPPATSWKCSATRHLVEKNFYLPGQLVLSTVPVSLSNFLRFAVLICIIMCCRCKSFPALLFH